MCPLSMKNLKFLLLTVSIAGLSLLTHCFELFPEEAVTYEGRIYESFDLTKPLDSVLVQGCTQQISLFPNWPTCDIETHTDEDGYFFISFQADGLEGRGIGYFGQTVPPISV